MIKSGIYKITNIKNNKFYIGSAINISRRWYEHKNNLKYNRHCNRILQNSFNKYGYENFIYEVLEYVDDINNLILREQYWFDLLNPTFNIAKIAGNSLGIKHSEETKKKISELKKGIKLSEEHKKKIGIASKNRKRKKHSEETRKKISEVTKGKKRIPFTNEHKIKISKNQKGGNNSVARLVLNLETGIYYETLIEAAISINMNKITLGHQLRGRTKNKTNLKYI
jgi:group I intron endonuclease